VILSIHQSVLLTDLIIITGSCALVTSRHAARASVRCGRSL